MKRNKLENLDGPTTYVDAFDRAIGVLHGLPDVSHSNVAVRRVVPLLGVGGTELYVVQTYRQKDQGDTIFLVIPPQVSAVIARQREQLTAKTRSKAAKAVAQARKERGEVPAFLKSKRKPAGAT